MKERVPNTSEPFYKVNKMEAATAYPRLNATSYFESSSNASLLVSPLAVSLPSSSALLQTGCTDVIAPSLPALPRLFFFFFSTEERGKQFRPAKGDHLASNFASERPAVLFNLEERKGGRYWESGRVVAGQDWNERERNRSIKFTQAYFKEIEGKRCA